MRCGGGVNHRMALGDAALIKDNHVAAAGGITAAVEAVRADRARRSRSRSSATPSTRSARRWRPASSSCCWTTSRWTTRSPPWSSPAGPRCRLEASGGLTLDRAREVAATGVDYLAVGALTHSAPVLDLGFDLRD